MRSFKKVSEYLGIAIGVLALVYLTTSLDRSMNPIETKQVTSSMMPALFDQTLPIEVDSLSRHEAKEHLNVQAK